MSIRFSSRQSRDLKNSLRIFALLTATLTFTTACTTNTPADIANLRTTDLEPASTVIQFSHNRYAKGPLKPKQTFAGVVDSAGKIELYKMGRIATSRPLWDEHGLSLIDEKWLYSWNHQFEKHPAENGDSITGRVRIIGTDKAFWLSNEGFVGDGRYLVRAITSNSNKPHYQLLTSLASCETEVFGLAANYPHNAANENNQHTVLTVTRLWKDGKPRDDNVISGVKFSDYDDMILEALQS
ncbi:hypothetical protein [Bowdeniella nasicola]|uniref:hypothetical protein n=1 Tax=Bowdeniella nasicola TaxID=208480 RepID=UPI0011614DD1|nr:hypothetical protein [Bowdeniella nasicola]